MIADPKIKAGGAERNNLMINEVLPCTLMVGLAAERLASLLCRPGHILVDLVDGSKVSQMPVESRLVFLNSLGSNCRHDDVATVAGIPGNDEPPGALFWGDEL